MAAAAAYLCPAQWNCALPCNPEKGQNSKLEKVWFAFILYDSHTTTKLKNQSVWDHVWQIMFLPGM